MLISSAAISAITLSVMDSRRPDSSEGSADGSTTSRTSAHRLRPNVRIASTSRASTLRTPPAVETYMGNAVATAIRTTLATSPIPNQTMKSGTSDRNGKARSSCNGESSSSSPSRENPVITPKTTPAETPNASPRSARSTDTPIADWSWPLCHSCHAALATCCGEASTAGFSAPLALAPHHTASRASGPMNRSVTDTPGRRGLAS